jgi:AcrR family transcriptional regulator
VATGDAPKQAGDEQTEDEQAEDEQTDDQRPTARPGRRSAARERMLQAGLDAWIADPPPTPFENLEVRDVVAAAGRTNGAFYNLWPSVEEYRRDLLRWVLDPSSFGTVTNADELITAAAEAIRASEDPIPLVRIIAQTVVEANINVASVRTVALVQYASLVSAQGEGADHAAARKALQDSYQGISDFYDPAYTEILAAWRRRVRPPWDTTSASMAMTALIDGYIMRSLFDDSSMVGPDVFADALLAIITSLTEAEPGQTDFDAWTASQLGTPPEVHADLERRIAVAVRDLYRGDLDFRRVTVASVAAASGVSERAVVEAVGSQPWDLCIPIWRHHLAPQLEDYAARLRADGTDPLERVASILHALAEVASRDRAVTAALLHVVHASSIDGRPAARSTVATVLQLAAPELVQAHGAGRLDPTTIPDADAAVDAARSLAVAVLSRLASSTDGPAAAVDRALALGLPGILARP